MQFEFATAARIVFGPGSLKQVPAAARQMGSRPLIVTGVSGEARAKRLRDELRGVPWVVPGEPTIDLVRRGVQHAREERCDMVVSFGGGSAIDCGKAIAALLTNQGDPLDYVEVIGRGGTLDQPAAPYIAIPTTAGTGSEVTRNAVLGSPEHGVKVSLRSPFMLPRLAVVDPELTYDAPRAVTASTGLDALTQLIEPYVCNRANPVTDGFCIEGLRRAPPSLRQVYRNGADSAARSAMSAASLLSGLALANAGLGAVHGFAAPIGGAFHAPHGAICAALLPHATAVNIQALRSRAPGSEPLRRYEEVAHLLTGKPAAAADDAAAWISETCAALEIPPLRVYGIAEAHVPGLVEKARQASSMKANPISLTDEELETILTRAISG